MKINLNESVRIRLTDYGRKVHRRQWEQLREETPFLKKYSPPVEDADGWSTWQLWQVMKTFGPYVSFTGPASFESDIELNPQQYIEEPEYWRNMDEET